MAQCRRGRDNIIAGAGGTDEVERRLMHAPRELPIPVLTLLAQVDGVQQVGARVADVRVGDGAEVRNRNPLYRWFREKQKTDGGVGGLREGFELLERWLDFTALPGFQLPEASRERIDTVARTLTRPADQFGLDGDAGHGTTFPRRPLVTKRLPPPPNLLAARRVIAFLRSRKPGSGATWRRRPGRERAAGRTRHTGRADGGCHRGRPVGRRFRASPDPPATQTA